MKAILFAALFLSLNAHALYVTDVHPKGTEVDPNLDNIKLDFSTDITALGTSAVSDEHKSKIKLPAGIDCNLFYQGTKTILCKLKKKLAPSTDYKIGVATGFTGLKSDERLSYEYDHTFKTNSLAITDYKVEWSQNTPIIALNLNFKVKETGRSGIIQCADREIPVTFEPMRDKKGESQFRAKATTAIKPGEMCVFYFNQPLTYRDTPGSFLPQQKVIIDQTITKVGANVGPYQKTARCSGNYQLSVELFSYVMPYLQCEFNDGVNVDMYLASNKSIDIKKYVTIIPNDGTKVSYTHEGIHFTGFKAPGKTYLIKIKKGIPTGDNKLFDADIIFQVETINNPPLLAAAKATGVIERDGPWQVAYSALNIKNAELVYGFISQPAGLGEMSDMLAPAQMLKDKQTIQINSKENENHLLPLDVKKLAKDKNFKAGLFSGYMKVKDVDPKFVEAESIIFTDANSKQYRREFKFGYLFTNIGLHVKKGRGGVLVWAFGLKEGTPLPETEIRLYRNGVGEETLTTDGNGLAFFPDFTLGKEEKFVVVAKKGDDVSFVNNQYGGWNAGISKYDFNFGGNYWQEPQDLILDVVAERPLYLPNEKVNLKFFVRKFIPDSLDLMETGKKVKISIFDPRGDEALVTHIELNDYGTGTLEYQLPPKAITGRYSVYVQEGASTITQEAVFQVEEFRKPDFKIVMEDSKDSVKGKITYFKGGAVKNAAGEVAVLFRKVFMTPKDQDLERFSYPGSVSNAYEYYDHTPELKVISRSEIESDENGEFVVNKAGLTDSINEYGNLIIEGAFKDESGGTISGRVETLHNPYDLIPGINLTKWLYNSGESIMPEVVVLNKEGKAVQNVKMKLTMTLITYIYERRLGSGNYFYYDSRKEEKVINSCSFTTAADFKSCGIEAKEAGYYEFTVKVDDPKLKADEAKVSTYVYSKGSFLGFESANHDRININVDKSRLKLGDKLKIMAISPLQDAEALITFERDGILFKDQVKFSGNVLLYEKDITDEKLIPGFYVSVVIIKGRTSDKIEGEVDLGKPAFKIGYKRVEVENTEKRLTTKVVPARKQTEPGQMMEGSVEVKDFRGKGVQSELAIAVVDDALLSVSGPYKKNYDVLDTFYTLGTLGVENYQTLTQLIGRRTFGKKGANAGGGGGFEIRSDFKNTAYWVAQVETDQDGKHKFKFKVPDNLTTWKIIAVAVDKNHRFGFGEDEFIASKSLMIEPALPNFLVEGDKFDAKVIVTNRSGKKQDLSINALSSTLTLSNPKMSLGIDHDNKKGLIFPATALKVGLADLTITAEGDNARDGMKKTFPVLSNAIKHVYGTQGLVAQNEVSIPLVFAPDAKDESLSLTLQYSSTAINGLDEVFRYVLGYPYGCWEQKLTKAYFLVQYEEFKDMITYRFPETQGSTKTAVQKLLDVAGDYQTPSGGMRYYPGGSEEADVYLSVFTGYSFVTMKELGYKIDPKVEANLRQYLKGLVTSDINWNSWYYREARNSTKAMLLSVLSDMGEKNLNTSVSKLFSERDGLDLFGLSFLAGYMSGEKNYQKEAKTLIDKLESLRVTESGRTSYKEPYQQKDGLYKFWNYTDTRSTCATLQNLVKFSNDKAQVSTVVRFILQEMDGGKWYNTQENIYCFEALRRYVKKFESKSTKAEMEVKVGEAMVKKEPSVKKGVSTILLTSGELRKDTKNVSMKSAEGELYYSSVLRYETPFKEREKQNQGFGLTKKFYKLEMNKEKASWLLMKDATLRLKRGDVMKIVIEVDTIGDRYQVLLNDSLAGCLEPINTQLATTSKVFESLLNAKSKNYLWETPFYKGDFEYLDLRLDAAQFYSRKLGKGHFEVEYMVQTIATGEFTMPEATIEEMYYPDVRGTEKGRKLVVTE